MLKVREHRMMPGDEFIHCAVALSAFCTRKQAENAKPEGIMNH